MRVAKNSNVGALIMKIGFGGFLYYNYIKDPPPQKKTDTNNYLRPLY